MALTESDRPPRSRKRTAAAVATIAATAASVAVLAGSSPSSFRGVRRSAAGSAASSRPPSIIAPPPLSSRQRTTRGASSSSSAAVPGGGGGPRRSIDDGPLANLRELGPPGWVAPGSDNDVPVFWVVPKAGTSTIKAVLSKCLGLTLASSTSQMEYSANKPTQLEVVSVDSGSFVNVDFATPPGILWGKELGLVGSGLVQGMASSYVHEMASVFDSPPVPEGQVDTSPKGKMFAIFRHPVERMVSDFYYMQGAKHEFRTYDPSRYQELEEYASDPTKHVDNWMVRLLSDNRHGPHCYNGGCPVTDEDYEYARTALKRKCIVLLMDEMEESARRLVEYGGWSDRVKSPVCLQNFATKTPGNTNVHAALASGTDVYEKFREANRYDILLYWYAKKLFEEQGARFTPAPDAVAATGKKQGQAQVQA